VDNSIGTASTQTIRLTTDYGFLLCGTGSNGSVPPEIQPQPKPSGRGLLRGVNGGDFLRASSSGGVVLGLLAFLSSSTASAQVATGSIAGTVSDSTGQIVPGAQVTIREVNRNTSTTLVTDGSGVYTAPFLVPDTSLSKRFSIGGRANAEVRWDVFNLFNHPGFGFPNAAIGNPTVGRISTTVVDNRSMQFALKVNF
jgi:hypothetical protein